MSRFTTAENRATPAKARRHSFRAAAKSGWVGVAGESGFIRGKRRRFQGLRGIQSFLHLSGRRSADPGARSEQNFVCGQERSQDVLDRFTKATDFFGRFGSAAAGAGIAIYPIVLESINIFGVCARGAWLSPPFAAKGLSMNERPRKILH